MATESFFTQMANEVLEASERIATRMEEGISIIMTGKMPDGTAGTGPTGQEQQQQQPQQQNYDDILGNGEFDMDDADLSKIDGLSEEELQELLRAEMMQNSPLEGLADSVIGNIVSGQVQPESPMEHFHAFRSAITWSETFIVSLITFQIFMFLLCLWVSKRNRGLTPRVIVMVFIGIVVRSAEYLNNMGSFHWKKFCTQNYFDRRGIFIGIMLCGPLLIDSLMMLVLFLVEASQLLIDVKREEIKRKKKKKNTNNTTTNNNSKQASTTTTTTTNTNNKSTTNSKKRSTKTRKED